VSRRGLRHLIGWGDCGDSWLAAMAAKRASLAQMTGSSTTCRGSMDRCGVDTSFG